MRRMLTPPKPTKIEERWCAFPQLRVLEGIAAVALPPLPHRTRAICFVPVTHAAVLRGHTKARSQPRQPSPGPKPSHN
jgi:hypothetical protein